MCKLKKSACIYRYIRFDNHLSTFHSFRKKMRSRRYVFETKPEGDKASFSDEDHKVDPFGIKLSSRIIEEDLHEFESSSKSLVDEDSVSESKHCVFGRRDTEL